MQAVRELDYVAGARMLTSLSGTIAVLMNNVNSEFFMNIAAGIEEQAVASGRICLFSSTRADPERELAMIDLLRGRGVEAVILAGGIVETSQHRAELAERAVALERSGSHLVLCGRAWTGPDAPIGVVDYDAEEGAFAATSYLLTMGHRQIAHLGGQPDYRTAQLRLRGYERALAEFGVTPDPKLVAKGRIDRGVGYKNARRILQETSATAVFAVNDLVAAGAIAAARDLGRTLPDDLSVVGFDDVSLAQDVFPALTTVHVPQLELGRAAARMAMYEVSDDADAERVVLGAHIVVRDSVKRLATR
jgi:LacI family transcriptional regulator